MEVDLLQRSGVRELPRSVEHWNLFNYIWDAILLAAMKPRMEFEQMKQEAWNEQPALTKLMWLSLKARTLTHLQKESWFKSRTLLTTLAVSRHKVLIVSDDKDSL